MTLSIMGDRIQLTEDPLVDLPLRETQRGARVGTSLITFRGREVGRHEEMERLAVNISGLNDLRGSEIPILSDRFALTVNGWYRIINASVNTDKFTGVTTTLRWLIQARKVYGQHDIYLAGGEKKNVQGSGNSQLTGLPRIGIPNDAIGEFFPAAAAGGVSSVTQTTEENNSMRLYSPTIAQSTRGLRYVLDASDGEQGQVKVDFEDSPVIGQKSFTDTPDKWSLSNGLVTLEQDRNANNGSLSFGRGNSRMLIALDFLDADNYPDRVSVVYNEYYGAAVTLIYSASNARISNVGFLLYRGDIFASIRGVSTELKFDDINDVSAFSGNPRRYFYRTVSGVVLMVGSNGANFINESGRNKMLLTNNDDIQPIGYMLAYSGSITRDNLHRTFLGGFDQRIRMIRR